MLSRNSFQTNLLMGRPFSCLCFLTPCLQTDEGKGQGREHTTELLLQQCKQDLKTTRKFIFRTVYFQDGGWLVLVRTPRPSVWLSVCLPVSLLWQINWRQIAHDRRILLRKSFCLQTTLRACDWERNFANNWSHGSWKSLLLYKTIVLTIGSSCSIVKDSSLKPHWYGIKKTATLTPAMLNYSN